MYAELSTSVAKETDNNIPNTLPAPPDEDVTSPTDEDTFADQEEPVWTDNTRVHPDLEDLRNLSFGPLGNEQKCVQQSDIRRRRRLRRLVDNILLETSPHRFGHLHHIVILLVPSRIVGISAVPYPTSAIMNHRTRRRITRQRVPRNGRP